MLIRLLLSDQFQHPSSTPKSFTASQSSIQSRLHQISSGGTKSACFCLIPVGTHGGMCGLKKSAKSVVNNNQKGNQVINITSTQAIHYQKGNQIINVIDSRESGNVQPSSSSRQLSSYIIRLVTSCGLQDEADG